MSKRSCSSPINNNITKKINTKEIWSEETVTSSLENIAWDFQCAVAVWKKDSAEMSNEDIQFLNHKADNFGCISRCVKYKLRSQISGFIFLFENKDSAIRFHQPFTMQNNSTSAQPCCCSAQSLRQDYPFTAQLLEVYLRSVAEIEESVTHAKVHNSESKIILRNLRPVEKVTDRVLQLCSIFGSIKSYKISVDVGRYFKFHHILVSFKYAVQAITAKFALDGKWIEEQNYPLAVEIYPDEKIRNIRRDIFKRNITIFQS